MTTNSLVISFNANNYDLFNSVGSNPSCLYIGSSVPASSYRGDAAAQLIAQIASTGANFGTRISGTNSYSSGGATNTLHKNGSAGNQTNACGGAGSNTIVVDATHTDSFAAGDKFNANFSTNSTGPDITIPLVQMALQASSPAEVYACTGQASNMGGAGIITGGTTYYFPVFGALSTPLTAEANVQQLARAAGVLKGLSTNMTIASTSTLVCRKNGAAGNQTISQGTAGQYSDTTHTDSVASGDLVDTSGVFSTSAQIYSINYSFAGSTSKHDLGACNANTSITSASTWYFPPAGVWASPTTTTESYAQSKAPYAYTASRLRFGCSANTSSTLSLTSRKNAAAGNQACASTSGATGTFEDATHTDSYSSGDEMNVRAVSTGTSQTITSLMLSLDDGSNTGSSTETGTASLAFAGVSFSASARAAHAAAASLAFAGVAFAGHAADFTASAVLAFSGIGFAGAAADFTASGALHFGGIGFAGVAADAHAAGGVLAFGGIGFAGVATGGATARIAEAFVADLVTGGGSARVAEAFVADLTRGGGEARIAEAFASALTSGPAGIARITEAYLTTLSFRGPCATERCQVWKITRRDGAVLAFTSLDVPITWGGVAYQPCKSLAASAAESSSELRSVGNVELNGVLDDEAISASDLYAGLYDDAFVEVWMISYGAAVDPQTPFRIAAGWIGKVTRKEYAFTAEVLGPGGRLQQTGLVDFVTPGCRWTFGLNDGRTSFCPVDVEALKMSAVPVVSSKQRTLVTFTGTEPVETAIWNGGLVRWLTGKNAGVECQVDTVDFTVPALSLWDLAPWPPQPGDTFDLLPGCPLVKTACQTYGAYESFGGFDNVPGPDALQSNADSLFT